nr:MAG TPA_asm: hypothetical protein [Caudoviricetes sp.]
MAAIMSVPVSESEAVARGESLISVDLAKWYFTVFSRFIALLQHKFSRNSSVSGSPLAQSRESGISEAAASERGGDRKNRIQMSYGLQPGDCQFQLSTFGNGHLHNAIINDLSIVQPETCFGECVKSGLLQIIQVTATAIRHVALNADFHRHSQTDIQHCVFNDSGDVIAVCLPFCADVRAPAIMAVVAVIARRPGQCDVVSIHALITPSFSQITCVLAIPSSAHSLAYAASTKCVRRSISS